MTADAIEPAHAASVHVVGHDVDGRVVTFHELERSFHIAGVPIGLAQFARYARKGMILWVSDETRDWYASWDRVLVAAQNTGTPVGAVLDQTLKPRQVAAAPAPSAEFTRAKKLGSEGERRVSKALKSGATPGQGYVLDDVLLRNKGTTAQIDHVVVDVRGVVLVETKCYHATIMGRESDSHWTACYGGGRNRRFQNPLAQNRYHESALLSAFDTPGWKLPPDYLESLIVFVDSRIDRLELRADTKRNVIEASGLGTWSALRRKAEEGTPLLSSEQVNWIVQRLQSLDQSQNPETQEQHQRYQQGRRR